MASEKNPITEEELEEILSNSLRDMVSDIAALNKSIDFNDANPRKLATLVNSKAKLTQQLLYCIAMLRDPKLKLMTDNGQIRDLAGLIEKAYLRKINSKEEA
jgi:DNA polymerase III delta prime subunit